MTELSRRYEDFDVLSDYRCSFRDRQSRDPSHWTLSHWATSVFRGARPRPEWALNRQSDSP